MGTRLTAATYRHHQTQRGGGAKRSDRRESGGRIQVPPEPSDYDRLTSVWREPPKTTITGHERGLRHFSQLSREGVGSQFPQFFCHIGTDRQPTDLNIHYFLVRVHLYCIAMRMCEDKLFRWDLSHDKINVCPVHCVIVHRKLQ